MKMTNAKGAKTERTATEGRPAASLPPTGSEMDHALRDLADLAVRYPFRWFSQQKVARICGFGDDVLTALAALGAPIIARKCNPHLLQKWLEENVEKVGKIRTN